MEGLDAEVENLRAAMAYFSEAGQLEACLRLANASWEFCHARGYYEMGRAWLEDALSKCGGPTPLRARALTGAGVLAFLQCDYGRARERLGQSLSLYEEPDDRRGVAEVTDVLGGVARASRETTGGSGGCTKKASPCGASSETSTAWQSPCTISASSFG